MTYSVLYVVEMGLKSFRVFPIIVSISASSLITHKRFHPKKKKKKDSIRHKGTKRPVGPKKKKKITQILSKHSLFEKVVCHLSRQIYQNHSFISKCETPQIPEASYFIVKVREVRTREIKGLCP